MDKNNLFDFNVVCDQKQATNLINKYLDIVKEKGAITNYSTEAKKATWEDFYPFMPERLLAIEAADRYGTSFHDKLPEHLQSYPYREQKWAHLRFIDEDGEPYYEIVKADEVEFIEGYESVEYYSEWRIDDPTYVMLVDLKLEPIRSIKYIKFKYTIKNDKSFEQTMKEID